MSVLVEAALDFQPTTLESIDQSWLGQRRFDRKFLLTTRQLQDFFVDKTEDFAILEITGSTDFAYQTDYFDNPHFDCYLDHAQGKQRRAKIRFRRYLDSGHSRLEVKLRQGNLQSRKIALEDSSNYGAQEVLFVEDVLTEFLPTSRLAQTVSSLTCSAINTYSRSTLVYKNQAERITLDSNLKIVMGQEQFQLQPDLVLVEVKSMKRNAVTVRSLIQAGHRPVSFSKYCVGLDLVASERPRVHTRKFIASNFLS
ncbi:MAG: polyphosphate polymerase domain-containing protein [Actinobacteria bacterium]|nr:polyphosphate polymerase domain-containing protein [Actinomycetota bacterium]